MIRNQARPSHRILLGAIALAVVSTLASCGSPSSESPAPAQPTVTASAGDRQAAGIASNVQVRIRNIVNPGHAVVRIDNMDKENPTGLVTQELTSGGEAEATGYAVLDSKVAVFVQTMACPIDQCLPHYITAQLSYNWVTFSYLAETVTKTLAPGERYSFKVAGQSLLVERFPDFSDGSTNWFLTISVPRTP